MVERELRSRRSPRLRADFNDMRSQSPEPRHKTSSPAKVPVEDAAWGSSTGFFPGGESFGPLFLMGTTPCFIFFIWFVMTHCAGDVAVFYAKACADEILWYGGENAFFPSPVDPVAWTMIGGFAALELAFMKLMPGSEFKATVTPMGNVPVYKANGMQSFVASLAVLAAFVYNKQVLNPDSALDPSLVYDKFGEILSGLNVFALLLCACLTLKGYTYPSSSDSGTTGNWIVDYYWGTELYPRLLGWDVKTFTNCRFGMMYWAVGICCYAYKQFDVTGAVSSSMFISVFLQLVYIAKFFWWETGYWCSMDIQHDRAGYYLCWGCLCWVPAVYASQSFFLVNHPVQLSPAAAAVNLVAGVLAIWINYDADRQRQFFRKCNGRCLIWGAKPVMIKAKYTSKGEERSSLLLASGWWGISRHFHYIPEITAAFFWTVPFACDGQILPFFYVVYLTILLFDRAFRDDTRCATKYGEHWKAYCAKVPYKIIPGVV